MAGLDPATQCERLASEESFKRADARLLGGRIKCGHGDGFNYAAFSFAVSASTRLAAASSDSRAIVSD